MTLAAFFTAGGLAWLHFATLGRVVYGPVTVWIAWFACVLIVCGIECLRSRERACIMAWGIMAGSFALSMTTWAVSANPLLDLAAKNLIAAGLFAMMMHRVPAVVAGLHVALVVVAFLAAQGLIPGPRQRPAAFLAWSYPDIAAGLRHACLIALGSWAGGLFARSGLDRFRMGGATRRRADRGAVGVAREKAG